jgi:hypothetical protein
LIRGSISIGLIPQQNVHAGNRAQFRPSVVMKHLLSGVTLLFKGIEYEPSRIQIARATVEAVATKRLPYECGAIIPRSPWSSLNAREQNALLTPRLSKPNSSFIMILKLPPKQISMFRELQNAAGTGNKKEVYRYISTRSFTANIKAFTAYLERHYQCAGKDSKIKEVEGGILINSPGMPTTTRHPTTRKLVGLHLDDWSRLPLDNRKNAENRMCVNLGSQDRHFLFLNLLIDQVYKAVAHYCDQPLPEDAAGTDTARKFLRLFPLYPICRLRLRPGDAYIAPTEQVVHDGSSLNMSGLDVTLSLRGRFLVNARGA